MKIRLLFLLLFFMGLITSIKAQNSTISFECNNLNFNDFCKEVSKQSKVRIYFNDAELSEKNITLKINNATPISIVKQAIDTLYYQAILWNNSIIITKDYIVPTKVVRYSYEMPIMSNDTVVKKRKQYYKTNKAGVLKKIIIGKKGNAPSDVKVEISGSIINSETGMGIPGATIYIKSLEKGAVANKEGVAKLQLYPGKYVAVVKSVGMNTQDYLLVVNNKGVFNINMQNKSVLLSSIDIYGDRQMSIMKRDPGIEKVSGKTLKKLPVMAGEPDVIKASTMLPGIVSVGEGTSGLNVRGGGADQNAFYLNKIPVFNTSHMLGFFPAFNADLIRDFTIYKGYIPSKYGGKLSSVFDIETRKGNRKKFSLHGGISPMAANMVASIPIIEDTLSVLVSGRKSFSNWILHRIDDPSINKSNVDFSDVSFGVYYDLAKTQISLFGYHSYDLFSFSDLNEYEYSTNGLSLQVGQSYGKKIRANYSLIGSTYRFGTMDNVEPSQAYEHAYKIDQHELKADFSYIINKNNKIEAGINSVYYGLNRGDVEPIYDSKVSPIDLGAEKGIENAIYFNDVWSPFERLELNGGFRFTIYNSLGPRKTYSYLNDQLIDESYIIDTNYYGNNEIVSTNYFPEFRFAAKFIVSKRSNVKISFTQMHQSLFMLNTIATVAPSSQWKLADNYLSPSKSNQFSLGFFHDLTSVGMEASVEGYYKHTTDYTEFRDGADFLGNEKVELSTLQGIQTSYGLEFMLRRRGEYRFTGWLAYTYSSSMVEVNGDQEWQKINNGKPYSSSYDIPHSVNLFLNIKLSKRVHFSSTVNYRSGRPITYPISIYYVNNTPFVDYSDRNEYRIPHYFRIDASLTVEGSLKRHKLVHSSFVFSVYNLTGRDNPYSVYFTANSVGLTAHQYSVIAIPVVTATWVFKLGNFDAN